MNSPRDAAAEIAAALADALRPDPIMLVSEWADRYRILTPQASSEAGPWRTARVPYLREPMDCLSVVSPVREVWFMAATQVGKTETGNNALGYWIDNAPGPILSVQETIDKQKRNVKTRIDPMLQSTPRLAEKVAEKRRGDGDNTLFAKSFPGGYLILAGANSAAGLKSMPARYLFLDEIDGYPDDLEGEGDPIALALARTRTFRKRRKVLYVSSPTTEGRSKIARGYEGTDRRRYFVPCPFCNHMQVFTWSRIKFEIEDRSVPARYQCEACGRLIDEHHKTAMMAWDRAEWRPTAESRDPEVRGYHISSLYSPVGWYSWNDARDDWIAAMKPYDQEKHRTFTNTVLAETWKEQGDAPEWERLYRRREKYTPGTVPAGGLFLTAGADVQADRVEIEVVAWGRHRRSWSVEYTVIPGDPYGAELWAELDRFLDRRFEHASGHLLPIMSLAIDSGYATQQVYMYSRRHPMPRLIVVKGSDSASLLIGQPTIVDIDYDGRKIRRGARVWSVGVSIAKQELYGWLRQELPLDYGGNLDDEPVGFCHFPEYPEDYFKGLTAEEHRRVQGRNGRSRFEWVKIRERNEPLDCRNYARAAAALLGMDRMQDADWERLELELMGKPAGPNPPAGGGTPGAAAPPQDAPGAARPRRPRRKSGYW